MRTARRSRSRSRSRSRGRAGRRRRSGSERANRSKAERRRRAAPSSTIAADAAALGRTASDWLNQAGARCLELLEQAQQGDPGLVPTASQHQTRSEWSTSDEEEGRSPSLSPRPIPGRSPSPARPASAGGSTGRASRGARRSARAAEATLEQYRGMMERGLITKADYHSLKRRALAQSAQAQGAQQRLALAGGEGYVPGTPAAAATLHLSPRQSPHSPAAEQLYYVRDGKDVPTTTAQLRVLYDRGDVGDDTQVCSNAWEEWRLLGDCLEEVGVRTREELQDEEQRRRREKERRRKEKAERKAQRRMAREESEARAQAEAEAREADEAGASRSSASRSSWEGDGEWEGANVAGKSVHFRVQTDADGYVQITELDRRGAPLDDVTHGKRKGDRIDAYIFGDDHWARLSRDGTKLEWEDGDQWTRVDGDEPTGVPMPAGRPGRSPVSLEQDMKIVDVEVLKWKRVSADTRSQSKEHVEYVLRVTTGAESHLIDRRWQACSNFSTLMEKFRSNMHKGDEWKGKALKTKRTSTGFNEARLDGRVKQLRAFFEEFSRWATWLRRKPALSIDFFAADDKGIFGEVREFLVRDSYEDEGLIAAPREDSPLSKPVVRIKVVRWKTVERSATVSKKHTQWLLRVTTGDAVFEGYKRWEDIRNLDAVVRHFSQQQPKGAVPWEGKLASSWSGKTTQTALLGRQKVLQEYFDQLSRWATDFEEDLFDPAVPEQYRILQSFFDFEPMARDDLASPLATVPGGYARDPVQASVLGVEKRANTALYVIRLEAGDGRIWKCRKRYSAVQELDVKLQKNNIRLPNEAKYRVTFPSKWGSDKKLFGGFDENELGSRQVGLADYWTKVADWASFLASNCDEDLFDPDAFPDMAEFLRSDTEVVSGVAQMVTQRRSGNRSRAVEAMADHQVDTNSPDGIAYYTVTLTSREGRRWECRYRYSAAKLLNDGLGRDAASAVPAQGGWRPFTAFDPKRKSDRWLGKFDETTLARRQKQLKTFWSDFAAWATRIGDEYGKDVFQASNFPAMGEFLAQADELEPERVSGSSLADLDSQRDLELVELDRTTSGRWQKPQPEPEPEPEPGSRSSSSMRSDRTPSSRYSERTRSSRRSDRRKSSRRRRRSSSELEPEPEPEWEPESEHESESQSEPESVLQMHTRRPSEAASSHRGPDRLPEPEGSVQRLPAPAASVLQPETVAPSDAGAVESGPEDDDNPVAAESSIYSHMKVDLRDLKSMLDEGVLSEKEFQEVKMQRLRSGLQSGWQETEAEKRARWEQEVEWEEEREERRAADKDRVRMIGEQDYGDDRASRSSSPESDASSRVVSEQPARNRARHREKSRAEQQTVLAERAALASQRAQINAQAALLDKQSEELTHAEQQARVQAVELEKHSIELSHAEQRAKEAEDAALETALRASAERRRLERRQIDAEAAMLRRQRLQNAQFSEALAKKLRRSGSASRSDSDPEPESESDDESIASRSGSEANELDDHRSGRSPLRQAAAGRSPLRQAVAGRSPLRQAAAPFDSSPETSSGRAGDTTSYSSFSHNSVPSPAQPMRRGSYSSVPTPAHPARRGRDRPVSALDAQREHEARYEADLHAQERAHHARSHHMSQRELSSSRSGTDTEFSSRDGFGSIRRGRYSSPSRLSENAGGRAQSPDGAGKKVRFFSHSAGKILVGTVIESDADYHTVSYRGSNGKERVKRIRREDCEEPF